MTYRIILLSAAVLVILTACAPRMTHDQQAFLEELANRPVTCTKGVDCDQKWARAIEWIKKNPTISVIIGTENFTITKLTKTTVQTNQSYTVKQHQGLYPGYRVIKYPREDGTYGFDFHTVCEQVACNPTALKLKAGFVTYVMGPPPGVTVNGGAITKTIHTDE